MSQMFKGFCKGVRGTNFFAKKVSPAILCLLLLLICSLPARADLRDYAPINATVTETSGALLAADNQLQTVVLTNSGSATVWICHAGQTAVIGKGFYLPAGATLSFSGSTVPQQGLNAISESGSVTVAIGRG